MELVTVNGEERLRWLKCRGGGVMVRCPRSRCWRDAVLCELGVSADLGGNLREYVREQPSTRAADRRWSVSAT